MINKKDNFRFVGLLNDKTANEEKTFNGVINFDEKNIIIQKKSRLNGKIKDSFEVSYDKISIECIDRKNFNKLEFEVPGHIISLKTIDEGMLDTFQEKLANKIQGVGDLATVGEIANSQSNNNLSLDIPDQIRKYHDLFEEGIISKEEFENKKKQLLEG